ncbi:hypothetical protein F5883DRAFT_133231 [Diaporthe sp. PMI_573]|nr:hypothetical protein F5883DRAFT_133231 [Diaporthaceae sp. PMI_573]
MRGVDCSLPVLTNNFYSPRLYWKTVPRPAVPAFCERASFDFCGERWAPGSGSVASHHAGSRRCVGFGVCVCVSLGMSLPQATSGSCISGRDDCPHSSFEVGNSHEVLESWILRGRGLPSTRETMRRRLSRSAVAGQWYNTDFLRQYSQDFSPLGLLRPGCRGGLFLSNIGNMLTGNNGNETIQLKSQD